jgi:hypothetical protein
MDSLKQCRQWKMDLRFASWNVGSLQRAGSLKTVASELNWQKSSGSTRCKVG